MRAPQRQGVLPYSRFAATRGNATATVATASSGVVDAPTSGTDFQDTKRETLEGPYHGKKAVVVGAGPGGSMAAILLARRGFDVKVYEQRKDPTVNPMDVQRSIVFVMNPEVTQLLRDIGIEVPLGNYSNGITANSGINIVNALGNVQTGIQAVPKVFRAFGERHCIANAVLQTAISEKTSNVEFAFESTCEDVDVDAKVVRFSNTEGEIDEVAYDLLVGADGVNSRIRGSMQKSGYLEFSQKNCWRKYVSVRNMPIPDELPGDLGKTLETGVINFVDLKANRLKHLPTNAVYYKTENNCVQMNIAGHTKGFENIRGKEREWVDEGVPPIFPEEWRQAITKSLQEKTLSTIGPVTYCSSYIGPDIALIGDACHSATPTLGIGANQAILDVKALDKALGEHDGNVQKALQAYDEETRPRVAAIQELEFKHSRSALEGRNPFWTAFYSVYFMYHTLGSKWLPKLIPPAAHFLMMSSHMTPNAALKSFEREAYIFYSSIAVAVFSAVALGLKASGMFI